MTRMQFIREMEILVYEMYIKEESEWTRELFDNLHTQLIAIMNMWNRCSMDEIALLDMSRIFIDMYTVMLETLGGC